MEIPGRHGLNRHGRMLHDNEFDICEMSLGSYVMAKSRGAPFTASTDNASIACATCGLARRK